MSGTEDTKQTGDASSQRREWDLRQASSMFAIRHQWDGLRSPALNLLQHPSPHWNQRELSSHASAYCTCECASTRTRPQTSGFAAPASAGSKSPPMSAITQQRNEQHWWLTWFPLCPEPQTSQHNNAWACVKQTLNLVSTQRGHSEGLNERPNSGKKVQEMRRFLDLQ